MELKHSPVEDGRLHVAEYATPQQVVVIAVASLLCSLLAERENTVMQRQKSKCVRKCDFIQAARALMRLGITAYDCSCKPSIGNSSIHFSI
jgi:hypothetical protein